MGGAGGQEGVLNNSLYPPGGMTPTQEERHTAHTWLTDGLARVTALEKGGSRLP